MCSSESYPYCLPDAFDNYLIGLQYKQMLFELLFRVGRNKYSELLSFPDRKATLGFIDGHKINN